jgi:tRNA pseudouridine38-40 synthase
MNEAAKQFIGLKDYRNFTDSEQEQHSTKTEIIHAEAKEFGDMILIHIVGSHFLWKQVRRMTGVLVETGRGNLSADDVASFFKGTTDIPAKLTAPPSGLFLENVWYKRDEIIYDAHPLIRI